MSNGQKLHYYLVYGEVAFKTADEEMGSIRLNGVVTNTKKEINVKVLGNAQQVLQMNFFRRMPDEEIPNIEVVDVIIANMVHMGHYSEEDWAMNLPQNDNTLQEKTRISPEATPFDDTTPAILAHNQED